MFGSRSIVDVGVDVGRAHDAILHDPSGIGTTAAVIVFSHAGGGIPPACDVIAQAQSRPPRKRGVESALSTTVSSMVTKPLLILDVDGVVLPLPRGRRMDGKEPAPAGYHNARAGGFNVWVPEHLQNELARLMNDFELAWCTSWMDGANDGVGALFGLPELPVLTAPPNGPWRWWKLNAVAEHAGQRPLVWADDDMTSSARRWAAARTAPTLLVRPRPEDGLSARVRVALRHAARPTSGTDPTVRFGELELDMERRRVTVDGADVHLTPTEWDLLKLFVANLVPRQPPCDGPVGSENGGRVDPGHHVASSPPGGRAVRATPGPRQAVQGTAAIATDAEPYNDGRSCRVFGIGARVTTAPTGRLCR